jgi:hypothetical protein
MKLQEFHESIKQLPQLPSQGITITQTQRTRVTGIISVPIFKVLAGTVSRVAGQRMRLEIATICLVSSGGEYPVFVC